MESKELFTKSEENPLLSSTKWPYPIDHVFNPAAAIFNNETVLFVRVEDRRSFSHLTAVRSKDGIVDWRIDSKPTLVADISEGEHPKGLEDPRIVWVQELEEYIIACVSFRDERINTPNGISLIGTKNFSDFRRISKPLDPENKNASLFPRRINDKFVLVHRPVVDGKSYIAVSFSDDLISWQGEKILFSARKWLWDSERIGLACPPIETEQGWVIFYHGSQSKANKLIYRVGVALVDLEDLELKRRSEEWVLAPEHQYEGGEDGIIFPCGYTLNEETQELRLYYGTNDSRVGLAVSNLNEVLDYLERCPDN